MAKKNTKGVQTKNKNNFDANDHTNNTVHKNENKNPEAALSIKLPQLVMTGIIDAENLANAAAKERGAKWNGKAGIVVEAQPKGYLVYAVDKLSKFEELILEPQIRHWA